MSAEELSGRPRRIKGSGDHRWEPWGVATLGRGRICLDCGREDDGYQQPCERVESPYPDKVHWHLLTSEDIRLIRTLYSQQWTKDDPKEIAFPDSLVVVPREHFTDFMEFKKVPGKIGKKESKG